MTGLFCRRNVERFANGMKCDEGKEKTAKGRLVADFTCTRWDDLTFKVAADRVNDFKRNDERRKTMQGYSEEHVQESLKKSAEQIALNLLETTLSVDTIAEKTGVSVERVSEMAKKRADDLNGNPTSELGKLIADFHCTRPEEMNNKVLAERVRYLKYTEEGRKEVRSYMDELWQSGRQEAFEEVAVTMFRKGHLLPSIVDITGVSEERIHELDRMWTGN